MCCLETERQARRYAQRRLGCLRMRQWREQISILSYLVSFGALSRFPHQLPRVAWRTTSSLSGELYVAGLVFDRIALSN